MSVICQRLSHPISYTKLPRHNRSFWEKTPIPNIQSRATRILKQRSESTIRAAVAFVHELLRTKESDYHAAVTYSKRPTFESDARRLHYALRTIEPSRRAPLRNFRRCEYFAVLALKLCSDLVRPWDPERSAKARGRSLPNLAEIDEALNEAEWTLLIAELLADASSGEDLPHLGLRESNRAASQARHKAVNQIKEQFASFAVSRSGSRAKIAREFWHTLSEVKQRQLAPSKRIENAVRTLTGYARHRIPVR